MRTVVGSTNANGHLAVAGDGGLQRRGESGLHPGVGGAARNAARGGVLDGAPVQLALCRPRVR